MIRQDVLLRQIHLLAQVLARVLVHKRAGETEQAQQTLADGLHEALGVPLEALRRCSRPELLDRCAPGGAYASGKAVAVADLLREDAAAAGRERALWLYEAALASGDAAVPLDVHDRIEALRRSLPS